MRLLLQKRLESIVENNRKDRTRKHPCSVCRRFLAKIPFISNTINISFDGVDAESLFVALKADYAFSNGSACNSRSHTPSYVLTEMGLNDRTINEAVRISWYADSDIDFYQLVRCIKSIQ